MDSAPRSVADTPARGPRPKTATTPAAKTRVDPPLDITDDLDDLESVADPIDASLDSEYGPVVPERWRHAHAGDLLLVDESLDIWGVVAADPRPDEGGRPHPCHEWRTDYAASCRPARPDPPNHPN